MNKNYNPDSKFKTGMALAMLFSPVMMPLFLIVNAVSLSAVGAIYAGSKAYYFYRGIKANKNSKER